MAMNFGPTFRAMIILAAGLSIAGTDLSWGKEPTPITECGQTVSGDAYLTGDLDCTGVSAAGVTLARGHGRLDFRGFAIRNAESIAVLCLGRCSLIGPGTIENNVSGARAVRRLSVTDLVVRNNTRGGLQAANNGYIGEVLVQSSRIEGNYIGIWAQRRVRLVDTVVTGNAEAGVLVLGEYRGILHVPGPVCTRGAAYLIGSTVSGNLTAPPVGGCSGFGQFEQCADIKTCVQSFADESSTCGTSVGAASGTSWGICSMD